MPGRASARGQTKEPAVSRPAGRGRPAGWAKSIVIALVIWIFVRALVVEGFHITSGSMERTLLIGDVLFVNKALYGAEIPLIKKRLPAVREPRRGDIVIFESVEEPDLTVIKRVVAVPGDTVAMLDAVVSINGIALHEPYVQTSGDNSDPADPNMLAWQARYFVGASPEDYRPTLRNFGPLAVPPDSFLVLGDNRGASYDGRFWGYLGRDRIGGGALFIYYSFDRNGILPLPFITAIRWGRLLDPIR